MASGTLAEPVVALVAAASGGVLYEAPWRCGSVSTTTSRSARRVYPFQIEERIDAYLEQQNSLDPE